jgi:cold shock CspA family protein
LANAVWSLNNDFFSNVKDSKGRIKSIILLRPDIFNSLGLQNRNTKLKDNSVVLNWITDYTKHRSSELFYLADRIFLSQQREIHAPGECWDNYFPFEAENLEYNRKNITSFVVFLRYSYHRPRDILTMLDILGEQFKRSSNRIGVFQHNDLFTSQFKETYGNYLLGEIRDSLSFYYDEAEFEIFLKFFEFLQGKKRFSYEEYLSSFDEFQSYITSTGNETPDFMRSPEEFLQFLYDQNILNFIEYTVDEQFIRWCFRERNANNISPNVKLGMTYEIHYGLANTLNTGKPFSKKSVAPAEKKINKKSPDKTEAKYVLGRVKFFDEKRGFGFIMSENFPLDIYFSRRDFSGNDSPSRNMKVSFEFSRSRSDDKKVQAIKVRSLNEK